MTQTPRVELDVLHPPRWQVLQPDIPSPPGKGAYQKALVKDESGHKWLVRIPLRYEGESLQDFAVRCLRRAARQETVARLTQNDTLFPPITPCLVVIKGFLDKDSHAGWDIMDAFSPQLFNSMANRLGDRALEIPALYRDYPLWAAASRWQPGKPLLSGQMELTHPLRPRQIAHLASTISRTFLRFRHHGLYYLPLWEHVLVLDNDQVCLTGLGHIADAGKVQSGDWEEIQYFVQGLLATDSIGLEEITDPAELSRALEAVAMRDFGYFLHSLIETSHASTHTRQTGGPWSRAEEELAAKLTSLARAAEKNVSGTAGGRESKLVCPHWQDVVHYLQEIEATPRRLKKRKRVGIALDYANVKTGLCGWALDLAGLVAQLVDPTRTRLVYRYGVIVLTPTREKEIARLALEEAGFMPHTVYSRTEHANQIDDWKLMELMQDHAREVDEVILITADGDYFEAIKKMRTINENIQFRIVSFSRVSHKYQRLKPYVRTVSGLDEYSAFIHPRRSPGDGFI